MLTLKPPFRGLTTDGEDRADKAVLESDACGKSVPGTFQEALPRG